MSKFKVGDKVRVVSKGRSPHNHFRVGDVVQILKLDDDTALCVRRGGYPSSLDQWVSLREVELVRVPEKIVVTTDGKTTTARLFSGKELVKSATAKCSPRDEFDFKIGAGIAVSRLLNTEEKAEPEKLFPLEDIKAGYLLKIRNTDDGEEFYMTVVPGLSYGTEKLGCCARGTRCYFPLSCFGKELCYGRREIREIWGYCHNKYLLDNKPSDRELLWSRK